MTVSPSEAKGGSPSSVVLMRSPKYHLNGGVNFKEVFLREDTYNYVVVKNDMLSPKTCQETYFPKKDFVPYVGTFLGKRDAIEHFTKICEELAAEDKESKSAQANDVIRKFSYEYEWSIMNPCISVYIAPEPKPEPTSPKPNPDGLVGVKCLKEACKFHNSLGLNEGKLHWFDFLIKEPEYHSSNATNTMTWQVWPRAEPGNILGHVALYSRNGSSVWKAFDPWARLDAVGGEFECAYDACKFLFERNKPKPKPVEDNILRCVKSLDEARKLIPRSLNAGGGFWWWNLGELSSPAFGVFHQTMTWEAWSNGKRVGDVRLFRKNGKPAWYAYTPGKNDPDSGEFSSPDLALKCLVELGKPKPETTSDNILHGVKTLEEARNLIPGVLGERGDITHWPFGTMAYPHFHHFNETMRWKSYSEGNGIGHVYLYRKNGKPYWAACPTGCTLGTHFSCPDAAVQFLADRAPKHPVCVCRSGWFGCCKSI